MKLAAALISNALANEYNDQCGGNITESNSVITFSNLGQEDNAWLSCQWFIEIPGATEFTVIPEYFDIEREEQSLEFLGCDYHYLAIRYLDRNNEFFCGKHEDFGNPPNPNNPGYSEDDQKNILWNARIVKSPGTIHYRRDGDFSSGRAEFALRIVAGIEAPDNFCFDTQHGSGRVVSRRSEDTFNASYQYFNNEICAYTLRADPGKIIKIRFYYFDLQDSSHCANDDDRLMINGKRYCGSYGTSSNAPDEFIVIKSSETVVRFETNGLGSPPGTANGFEFDWWSEDFTQEPVPFWSNMQIFFDRTKAQMESGDYVRPWRVPLFRRLFNRIKKTGIESYSQITGNCNYERQTPSYKIVDIKDFVEDRRCTNLMRMSEMGLDYIDSYVCMDGHPRPHRTLRRMKKWMKQIGDLGKRWCGMDIWEEGPSSLPSGLSCPAPEIQEGSGSRSSITEPEPSARIVGGQEVDRASSWPWIVDISDQMDSCGGSIISKNSSPQSDFILTSADCCFNFNFASFDPVITIGPKHLKFGFFEPSPGQFTVTQMNYPIIHPEFVPMSHGNDVCLIQVPNLSDATPDECDDCWAPVCLPQEHVDVGRLCYVAGWGGASRDYATWRTELNDVGVHVFSNEECDKTDGVFKLKESEFCAGTPDFDMDGETDAGKSICYADEGGPLVCKEGDTAVQYGVVSWGGECGKADHPGVYAKLAGPITQWIFETMDAVNSGNHEFTPPW